MDQKEQNANSGTIKNWYTWALLALLPGVTGWFIVLTQDQIQQNRSETFKSISRQQKEEFLDMYGEWSRLTTQDKLENPWGTGPYGGPEIQSKLLKNQEERLMADLPELLSDGAFPDELGDILYGPGWHTRVEEYRKQIEYQEILSICSSILIVTGGIGFCIGTGLLIRKKILVRCRQKRAEAKEARASSESEDGGDASSAEETADNEVHLFTKKKKKDKSDTAPSGQAGPNPSRQKPPQRPAAGESKPPDPDPDAPAETAPAETEAASQALAATALLTETMKAETDPLLSSLMTPEPVARELTELTEQMTAIREFAAEQQSQAKKFQDGYDWMLIKRFCLRIIRCIDNIDDRVRLMETEKKDTSPLEDIRDELIFALESSGVEPYEPELGRDYRGLEKYAEAVKDRKKNTDPEKTGKIAEIVRSGYQYLISDEEVKIVRCAQVKLYA